jgi:hypothetical protein
MALKLPPLLGNEPESPYPDEGSTFGEYTEPQKNGRRKRTTDEIKCKYCRNPVGDTHYFIPHPDGPPNSDLPDPHCSWECVLGAALWEIGHPLYEHIHDRVIQRAGRDVNPAVSYEDMLISGMESMAMRDAILEDAQTDVQEQGIIQREHIRLKRKGHKVDTKN